MQFPKFSGIDGSFPNLVLPFVLLLNFVWIVHTFYLTTCRLTDVFFNDNKRYLIGLLQSVQDRYRMDLNTHIIFKVFPEAFYSNVVCYTTFSTHGYINVIVLKKRSMQNWYINIPGLSSRSPVFHAALWHH